MSRSLLVIADDFGIGLPTSRGILDLARRGIVTGTVLLSHSPFAAESVQMWRRSKVTLEVGWHPCLTLDRPLLPARQVSSLVNREGRFWSLGAFLGRLLSGQVRASEIRAELTAQYERYIELVGEPPQLVNAHHHVAVFPPIGRILADILRRDRPLPYVRRVSEPWQTLARVPGARLKRTVLSLLGRHTAFADFPGNDWLAGVTDPTGAQDPEFLNRWVRSVPGQLVELACHPGHYDQSLVGRDCTLTDGMLERRVHEYELLTSPSFVEAIFDAGFRLTSPAAVTGPGVC